MSKRTKHYRKDPVLERGLHEINDLLVPIERKLVSQFTDPKEPIVFIVGAPRSATTLLHQLLAASGRFGYISNYLARFWKAPYFGALQEKALGIRKTVSSSFDSNFGRTSGWTEPHQFNYFWQLWFRIYNDHQMPSTVLDPEELSFFKQEIGALENFFSSPMIFKSLYCGLQIPFLKGTFPKAKFVVSLRDPLYQAQSNLLGRMAFFGNKNGWFSLKPKEYSHLVEKNVYQQVTGQIYYILRAIEKSLANFQKSDSLVIHHDNLVKEPQTYIKKIINLTGRTITDNELLSKIPKKFINRNTQKLDSSEWQMLEKAANEYFAPTNTQVPFQNFMTQVTK